MNTTRSAAATILPPPLPPACDSCSGEGVIYGACAIPASYYQPAEYDYAECPACKGTGRGPSPWLVDVILAAQLFWPRAQLELRLVASVRLARAGVRDFRSARRAVNDTVRP